MSDKNLVIEIARALLTTLDSGEFAKPERGALVVYDTNKKVSVFGLGGEEGEGLLITAALLKRAFELITRDSDTLTPHHSASLDEKEGIGNDG